MEDGDLKIQPTFRDDCPEVDTNAWKTAVDDVNDCWREIVERIGVAPVLMPNVAPNVVLRRERTLTALASRYRSLTFIAQTNAVGNEGNWLDIVEARAAAVSYTAVEGDTEHLREELLALAAHVIAWIVDTDRLTVDTAELEVLLEPSSEAA